MKLLVLIICCLLSAASISQAATILGPDLSDVTGIDGLVVDGQSIDIRFENVSTPFVPTVSSENLAIDITDAMDNLFNSAGVLQIARDITEPSFPPTPNLPVFVIPYDQKDAIVGELNLNSVPSVWRQVYANYTPNSGDLILATQVVIVPEPSSLVPFGVGVIALFAGRRRLRRA